MESLRQWLRVPEGRARKTLERTSTSLIVVALGTAPLEATPGMSEAGREAITWLELGILGIFTAEYLLGLWIAERPWKYAFSPYGVIDLAAILPFYIEWGRRRRYAPCGCGNPGDTPAHGFGSQGRSGRAARKRRSSWSPAH